MPPTPVRHVRVPGVLWDAAKAKAEGEFRTVADVIVECLRRYVDPAGGSPPVGTVDVNGRSAVPTPALQVPDCSPAVGTADAGGPPSVGTAGPQGNGDAAAVPTPAPRRRKPPAVTTAAELAKPPGQREDAVVGRGRQPGPRIAPGASELARGLMAPARGTGKPASCTHGYPDVRNIAGVDVCRKCG